MNVLAYKQNSNWLPEQLSDHRNRSSKLSYQSCSHINFDPNNSGSPTLLLEDKNFTLMVFTEQSLRQRKKKNHFTKFRKNNKANNFLTAVQRRLGEYWSSLDTRSTASGGIRL